MSVLIHKKEYADVTLLLEGTYPYVRGGVSSWVHQIIQALEEYQFSLVFLGGSPDMYGEIAYDIPENVVHFEQHYLFSAGQAGFPDDRQGNPEAFAKLDRIHEKFRMSQNLQRSELEAFINMLGKEDGITHKDLLYSREAWKMIRHYQQFSTDKSFTDYFWTVRTVHAPMFFMEKLSRNIPESRFYHTISTGYGGLIGSMLAIRRKRPLLISEHGIYTKERKIDLFHADWIHDERDAFSGGNIADISYVRRLWIKVFEGMGQIAYDAASKIISLYEGNRQRQLLDGAPEQKTMVIPNGINIQKFLAARNLRAESTPKVAGLIGRVVPIKDIKAFIRAMHLVCRKFPDAEGWIIGPDEEDPEYADECRSLAKSLGLDGNIKFLGMQKVDKIFPKLGVSVLTSISEGLPLVTLEGFAAGVPSVVTNVGACKELVEGRDAEDKAIGPAGIVTEIASPEETGLAIIRLLSDRDFWNHCRDAGIARVERYYDEKDLFEAYRALYLEMNG